MKFLRNLATDWGSNNARFLFFSVEKGGGEVAAETFKDIEEARLAVHADTQERLDMLKDVGGGKISEMHLQAAYEANEKVDVMLPEMWEKLKQMQNPSATELQKVAVDYLVNRTFKNAETRKFYRTEMFASFREKLLTSEGELTGLSQENISDLMLSGMGAVYKFAKADRLAGHSLKVASTMIKYDKEQDQGVNVTKWVEGGKPLTSYAGDMENSNIHATVSPDGKLCLPGGKEFNIKGCEILTGSAMMDYPKEYLQQFEFRNVIMDESGTRVMACVSNGCRGNLAVFELNEAVPEPVKDNCIEEQDEEDPCADCNEDVESALKEIRGWNKDDPRYEELMCNLSGEVNMKQEDAYNAYLKLYGRRKGKYKMENFDGTKLEQDGVYVVLEKYFNPAAKGGLFGMIKRIVGDKSLADKFEKAGYSREKAESLQESFANYGKSTAQIEANAERMAAKYEHQDAGATKEFFLELGGGALTGTAMAACLAFPPGWVVPGLLGGAPLISFRSGVKGHKQVPGVNEVYAMLSDPNLSEAKMDEIYSVFETTGRKTYLDLQKESLVAVDVMTEATQQTLGDPMGLIIGPHSKRENLTSEQQNYLDEANGYMEELDSGTENVNQNLQRSSRTYTKGMSVEAHQARRVKGLKLEKTYLLGLIGKKEVTIGGKRYSENAAFKEYLARGEKDQTMEGKVDNYKAAMGLLLEEVNETASRKKKFGPEWGEGFHAEDLNDKMYKGEELHLGPLDKGDDGYRHTLHAKFVPNVDGGSRGGPTQGKWEVYVKQNGETIVSDSKMEFNTGAEMIELGRSELKDKVGVLREERGDIEDKLDFFGKIVGHMAQLNEIKDHMKLIVETEKRQDVVQETDEMFDVEVMSDQARETNRERLYRLNVESTLKKFGSYVVFEEKMAIHKDKFGAKSLALVKDYYEGKEGAVVTMVENTEFQNELACVAQDAMAIQEIQQIDDLDACYKCVKDKMYFSGVAGQRESSYGTLRFAHLYAAYLVGEGLMSKEVAETVTKTVEHTIGGKTGSGGQNVISVTVTEQIKTNVQNVSQSAWRTEAVKKLAIVSAAAVGGAVTSSLID